MRYTTNATTRAVGCATATVIADSVAPATGKRITTIELVYPRIIHGELMTHRAFSRNAASSRATPARVCLDEVDAHPYIPAHWYENKRGMAGGAELPAEESQSAYRIVYELRSHALAAAAALAQLHVSKQQANRYLEPFLMIRTLVTATEWTNFFNLRLDREHVQPEMYDLAFAMRAAMDASKPVTRKLHLPYVEDYVSPHGGGFGDAAAVCTSVARCARVSYLTRHETPTETLKDIELAQRLLRDGHMSPFEHQAVALEECVPAANFRGWSSLRRAVEERGPALLGAES